MKEASPKRLHALAHNVCASQAWDFPEEAQLQTVLRSVAAGAGRDGMDRQTEFPGRDTTRRCRTEDMCSDVLVKLQA